MFILKENGMTILMPKFLIVYCIKAL